MAELHHRRPGGISARLVRLGLIEPETLEDQIGNSGAPPSDRVGPTVVAVPPATPAPPAATTIVEITEDVCRHDLRLPLLTCSICKNDDRPSVYLTAGGIRYHARPDCPALIEGQRLVEARGGTTEPIEIVHRGSSRLEGRDACLICIPP
jgi:hypothetical protein